MKNNKLADIIPIERATHILRTIAKSTEMNLCIVDLLGNTIIPPTNNCCFCSHIHKNPKGRDLCLWCATHAALEAARSKRPFFYKCPYGLVDFAVPLFYNDEVLGAIFGGELKIDGCDEKLDYCYQPIQLEPEAKKYFDEIEHSHFEKITYTAELLKQIIDNLETFTALMNTPKNPLKGEANTQKIKPALEYVHVHYNTNFSLKDVASVCCVSEPYMSRLFKSTMKCTLSQYVTRLRIDKAKELLADPNQKMLAIAYEVGYCDCAHFSKKFKQETGITPREYRLFITT